MVKNRKEKTPITIGEMFQALRKGLKLPPLELSADQEANLFDRQILAKPDLLITARTRDRRRSYTFIAEVKPRSTPQAFDQAVLNIRRIFAQRNGTESPASSRSESPMIVLPYLSDAALEKLEREQLSGIDLSGNGIVIVPDELYVYRSGQRNRYPESPPTKYAYRGATALVPRVFLCRPQYAQVSDIAEEVNRRGGKISLPTVSKALKRMESDALISRRGDTIRLLQPDALLDKLRESYRQPRVISRRTLALSGALEDFFETLPDRAPAVLGGASSVTRYAVMGRSDRAVVYCRDVLDLERDWQTTAREVDRFADIELCATQDDWVFFDARREGAIRYASPVQTYLELATGDKREQQAAEQVRERILEELKPWNPS